MQYFKYIDAKSTEEASSALKQYGRRADVIAGGTDLVGSLARDIKRPEYPEALIDIKSVPGLSGIKEEGGMLKIGALTKLADIAENSVVLSKYKALAQAAEAVARYPPQAVEQDGQREVMKARGHRPQGAGQRPGGQAEAEHGAAPAPAVNDGAG